MSLTNSGNDNERKREREKKKNKRGETGKKVRGKKMMDYGTKELCTLRLPRFAPQSVP